MTETKDAPDTQERDHPTAKPPWPNRVTSWMMANLPDELAALACVNEHDIRRRIENALGLLLGLWTAFQQSGGHHDHQVGERPPVGLATPDGPDPGRR